MSDTTPTTTGVMNYQANDVIRSLVSSGTMYVNRMITGSDEAPVGLKPDPISVTIHNGRDLNLNLDTNGFMMVKDSSLEIDFYDENEILSRYYEKCCQLVQKYTGASKVYAFDHNIRVSAKKSWLNESNNKNVDYKLKELKGGSEVQAPASVVHNDFTLTSAPRRLAQLAEKPKQNDVLRKILGENPLIPPEEVNDITSNNRRYMFINVWRSIADSPVEDMPLGLCDATTIAPEDLSTFEIRYVDRVGENYFASHRPEHKWIYFPKMSRDESILLKVWDSYGSIAKSIETKESIPPSSDISTFSFHSAFKDAQASINCPPRESIECRLVAIF